MLKQAGISRGVSSELRSAAVKMVFVKEESEENTIKPQYFRMKQEEPEPCRNKQEEPELWRIKQEEPEPWRIKQDEPEPCRIMPLFHCMVRHGTLLGGFPLGTVPGTWYFFSTTSAVVPSNPYRYQNVMCKLY